MRASVQVTNVGALAGTETVQLYVRDVCASATRPVKELMDFRRITLGAGECTVVEFELPVHQLAFHDASHRLTVEPGDFLLWLAGDSATGSPMSFKVAPS